MAVDPVTTNLVQTGHNAIRITIVFDTVSVNVFLVSEKETICDAKY